MILVGQSMGGHRRDAHRGRGTRTSYGPWCWSRPSAGEPDPETPRRIERWLASWPLPFASRAEAAAFFGGGPGRCRLGRRAGGARGRAGGRGSSRTSWCGPSTTLRTAAAGTTSACPALLVRAEDGIITAADAAEMARRRPGTRVVTVAGAGHDVHLEAPRGGAGRDHGVPRTARCEPRCGRTGASRRGQSALTSLPSSDHRVWKEPSRSMRR